jgi:hypothetical protein
MGVRTAAVITTSFIKLTSSSMLVYYNLVCSAANEPVEKVTLTSENDVFGGHFFLDLAQKSAWGLFLLLQRSSMSKAQRRANQSGPSRTARQAKAWSRAFLFINKYKFLYQGATQAARLNN